MLAVIKHVVNDNVRQFIASPIDLLCSYLVKFGRPEIGEIVRRCLLDRKTKQNFAWLSSCRYFADRAQYLPGPAPFIFGRVIEPNA